MAKKSHDANSSDTSKSFTADSLEQKELSALEKELAASDRAEESAWGIKTDKAAFGKERIKVPDRWY